MNMGRMGCMKHERSFCCLCMCPIRPFMLPSCLLKLFILPFCPCPLVGCVALYLSLTFALTDYCPITVSFCRSLDSFKALAKEKGHCLAMPDALISAVGTKVSKMHQSGPKPQL